MFHVNVFCFLLKTDVICFDTSRDGFISLTLLKTALYQFAFHSDDMSLLIAGLKSQAGNNKSVF
jgi:hypothetical protein